MKNILTQLLVPAALGLLLPVAHAAPLQQASVNQIVNDVKLIDPARGARPAVVQDIVRDELAVRTGIQSRTELLFQDDTLTRLGAETVFSFKAGTRDLTLDRGTMLLQVPKNHGGARIRTASVTASITGTTIMMEYLPSKSLKVVVLEGSLRLSPNGRLGEAINLTAGRMVIMDPGAKRIPEPVKVDLRKLVNTSSLINPVAFQAGSKARPTVLPSLALIENEIALQDKLVKSHDLAGTNLVIAGSGTEVVLASEEKLAQLDRAVVFDKGSVATANGQIETPMPRRLPASTLIALAKADQATTLPTRAGAALGGQKVSAGAALGEDTTSALLIPSEARMLGAAFTPVAMPVPIATPVTPVTPIITPPVIPVAPIVVTPPVVVTPGVSPAFIASPNPYVIDSSTVIGTAAQTIFTRGTTNPGGLYRSAALDGPASAFLFDTTTAFDAATSLDADFGAHSGGSPLAAGVAVYRFTGLQIKNKPTFNLAGGPTDLALIGQQGIAARNGGGAWEPDALHSLFFGTVDGPIGLANEIKAATLGTTFKYLHLDARGASGTITLDGKIQLPFAAVYLDAQAGITLGTGASFTAFNAEFFSPGAIVLKESTTTAALKITSGTGVRFLKSPNTASLEITAPRLQTSADLSTLSGFLNIGAGGVQAGSSAIENVGSISVLGNVEAGCLAASSAIDIGGKLTTTSASTTLASPSVRIAGGIDYNGTGGGAGVLNGAAGGALTVSANSVLIDPLGINGISANGSDGLLSLVAGGSGGTVNLGTASRPITSGITVNAPILATTGGNATGVATGGTGGKVGLTATGTIEVNATIKVSDSALTKASRNAGSITLTSLKTGGTAINIGSSGQLLSLLSTASAGTGGKIMFVSAGGDIRVTGGTIAAERGAVDIRNNGANGDIHANNTAIRGDTVKIGALGANGQLLIGGGTISAEAALKLYGGASGGGVRFTDDVTLGGAGTKTIAGKTVTIDPSKIVTIGGNKVAKVFTDNANYTGSGGNGSTSGAFAGKGATTQALSGKPTF